MRIRTSAMFVALWLAFVAVATAPVTVVTDAEGVATLEALAPSAQYSITAQLQGFQDQTRTQILVRSGQATPKTPARTSSSARWPAASGTSRAWSSCSASGSRTTSRR